MFGHLPELLIIMVVALIVFGPEKLPEVAGTVGRTVRDLRQAFDDAMHPEEEPVDFDAYYREYEALHPDLGGAEPEEAVWPDVAGCEGVETAIEEDTALPVDSQPSPVTSEAATPVLPESKTEPPASTPSTHPRIM